MSSDTRQASVQTDETFSWNRSLAAPLFDLGRRLKDALLYSTVYLVGIAMVQVATVMYALGLPPSPAPVVVGLVTFAVYAGDRVADCDTDEVSNPGQARFMRRHKRLFSVASAGAYGLAVAVSVLGGPLALAITLLPGAVWILYGSDWLPTLGSYFKRLKEVLVVNSAVVAGAWAVSLLFIPLAFADAALTPLAAVVFVYYFVDTFVNTEIPNVRDVEGDAAIGVSTLPVVFGVTRTRWILYGLDAFLVAFVVAAHLAGPLSATLTVAVLVGLAWAFGLAALVGRTERYGRLSVAGEAKHLLVFAVILALSAVGL